MPGSRELGRPAPLGEEGAQDLGALLPLGRGQAVVDVVRGHQAKGAVAVLGVVPGKKRWQSVSAPS